MSADIDDARHSWRRLATAIFTDVEKAVIYLCEPDRLRRRPEYRRHPEREWLTGTLTGLQTAHDQIRLLERTGGATEQEVRGLDELVRAAKQCVERNLSWVQEQLGRELKTMVEQYHRAYWVEAIRAGLPCEFWYLLEQRGKIEAHLRATELLHPALEPDSDLLRQVKETDALLREVGPELWARDPPTRWAGLQREWFYPREHWWWWLDEAPPPLTQTG